ncbi:hypothetical protein F4823DRAFT_558351 [Ustulina deusta]|nr:hypothetical protein F4823DRAFT_558351 [Ustulina deusta]
MRSARFELWTDVMTLERLRTRVLVQCHTSQDALRYSDSQLLGHTREAENAKILDPAIRRQMRHRLLEKDLRTTLRLTKWQILASLVPDASETLTDEQVRVCYQKLYPELGRGIGWADLSQFKPTVVTPDRLRDEVVHEKYKSLYKMLGNMTPLNTTPNARPSISPRRQTPQPHIPRPTCSPVPTLAADIIIEGRSPLARSRFAGKVHIPAKRGSSPDQRSVKIRRTDLSRQDLTDDLMLLKKDIAEDIKHSRNQLVRDLEADGHRSAESWTKVISTSLQANKTQFKQELTSFISEAILDLQSNLETRLQASRDQLMQELTAQVSKTISDLTSTLEYSCQTQAQNSLRANKEQLEQELASNTQQLRHIVADEVKPIVQRALESQHNQLQGIVEKAAQEAEQATAAITKAIETQREAI